MVIGTVLIIGIIVTMVAGGLEDTDTGLRTMATGVTGTPITATDAVVQDEMTMDGMTKVETTMAETTMEEIIMEGMTIAVAVVIPENGTIISTVTIRSVPGSLIPAITSHVHRTGGTVIPGRRTTPAPMVCGKRTMAI